MHCKNCQLPLRTDYSYCSNCGAKVIRNRITLKNLWYDITERYFNLDNTFLNTFLHLFTRPETVIGGYLTGVRKKYLNPVSYLAIALTMTGLLIFFLRKSFPDGMDFDIFGTGLYSKETSKRMTDFLFTFYSVLFTLYIPILALASWIGFRDLKLNFAESNVVFMYTQAQYSMVSNVFTLLILAIAPGSYMFFSLVSLALMIGYNLYVLKRISGFKGSDYAIGTFIFLVLFGVGYVGISMLMPLLMFATGVLSPEDFIPKK